MDFYSALSERYDEIFPLDPAVIKFVTSSLNNILPASAPSSSCSILDVGCATGSLAVALAGRGHRVTGIDLDPVMIRRAACAAARAAAQAATQNAKASDAPTFLVADMMDIGSRFAGRSFDRILCFGNTLAHLPDVKAIADFCAKARMLLSESGKLLVQILNYDRILDNGIVDLPAIETDTIRFTRRYERRHDNRLDFNTGLLVKSTGESFEGSVPLFPLRKAGADKALEAAGFSACDHYGGFMRAVYSPESFVLLIEARTLDEKEKTT